MNQIFMKLIPKSSTATVRARQVASDWLFLSSCVSLKTAQNDERLAWLSYYTEEVNAHETSFIA